MRNPRLLGGSKILVIEDEPDIARAVVALLERASYQVILSADGHAGLRMLHSARPDLVILDIGLPGMDGWNVLERIRDLTTVPIIMVTARTQEGDKVRGLQAGADDYMTKPFSNRELVARVEAHLRRATTPPESGIERTYSDARLTIDFLAHEVTCDDKAGRAHPDRVPAPGRARTASRPSPLARPDPRPRLERPDQHGPTGSSSPCFASAASSAGTTLRRAQSRPCEASGTGTGGPTRPESSGHLLVRPWAISTAGKVRNRSATERQPTALRGGAYSQARP